MRASLVRIGNSRGVRIPKALIEECDLGSTVELEVRDGQLVIRRADDPRAGWEEAFRQAAVEGDDDELREWEAAALTDWDENEWEW